MEIGDIVSFKHPKKKSKIFTGKIKKINGEEFEVGEIIPSQKEDILVIPKKLVKSVLDMDEKALKDIEKTPKEEKINQSPLMKEIFNFFKENFHDCPCILVPVKQSKSKTKEKIYKFEWNKEQFDHIWNETSIVPIDAIMSQSGDNVNITFTKPFSQTFVITGGAPQGEIHSILVTIVNALARIEDAIRAKFAVFAMQHDAIISDASDYVDATLNRIYEDIQQEQQQTVKKKTQFELDKENPRSLNGITIYRVKCTEDNEILKIKAGEVGGWVQSENNIEYGWVANEAIVLDKCVINGIVKDYANISGGAIIEEGCVIGGNTIIKGRSRLFNTTTKGKAVQITGDIKMVPTASLVVKDKAKLTGPITISGKVEVIDYAAISGTGRGLVIDGAKFSGNTIINAVGTIQGNPVFKGKNIISGEVKVDTRQAPGSVFSNISSNGSFKIKGSQVIQADSKPVESKEDIKEPEEQEQQEEQVEEIKESVIIKEIGPESISKSDSIARLGVKNPRQWTGPLVKNNQLNAAQKRYLSELIRESVDADTTPRDIEIDIEEYETKDLIFDVANIYTFYATLTDEGLIDTIWKLEPNILGQAVEQEQQLLHEEESFKVGDIVTPKKEFLDKGEEYGWKYEILEDNGNRVLVKCVDEKFKGAFLPTSTWLKDWIEHIKD